MAVKSKTIGIISPSLGLKTIKEDEIVAAVKHLASREIKTQFYQSSDKLEELYKANKGEADLLMASRGGFNCNELLPRIDFNQITKPLCGYSDITVLLNAFLAQTGKIQYLGPHLKSLAQDGSFYSLDNLIITAFEQKQRDYVPSTSSPLIVNQGGASGILVGGNLCSQIMLAGTKYYPVFEDMIVVAEEDDLCAEHTSDIFLRNLYGLLNYNFASHIKGLVIGRFKKQSKVEMVEFTSKLKEITQLKKIPIIAEFDTGHTLPHTTLPLGAFATLEAEDTLKFRF